jgi:hypothetical protein
MKFDTEQLQGHFFFKSASIFIKFIQFLTLSLPMSCMCGAPCKSRNFNVVYMYGPTFGNAESRLFLFAAQRFNIESMQKVILWHSCV